MIRISMYIAKEVKEKIDEIAEIEGRTSAEIIREALAMYLRNRGYLTEKPKKSKKKKRE